MTSVDKSDFKTFVEQQYAGIPDRTSTIEDKEKAIKAKKEILKHPDCPESSKIEIKKEIATIEAEIEAIKSEQNNTSIFPPRNNLG